MSTAIYVPPGGESGRELVSNSLSFAVYRSDLHVSEATTVAGAGTRVQEGEAYNPEIGRNRAMQITFHSTCFSWRATNDFPYRRPRALPNRRRRRRIHLLPHDDQVQRNHKFSLLNFMKLHRTRRLDYFTLSVRN